MKTINKEVSDSLHFLFHCSLKDTDYTTQREQFRKVYFYIEKLEDTLKEIRECVMQPNIDLRDNDELFHVRAKFFKELLEIIDKVGIGE